MRITKLEAENFKRLTAVSISPDGSAVVIGGRNGQGKSSALDAIEAALGGAKHAPNEPIRKGAKSARVVVETDTYVVTRRFTVKGSTLEVAAKDGAIVPSPQTLLDSLVGSLSFDPLEFTRKKAPEQAAILRRLVGLDLSAEDEKRKAAYDKRTDIGRELRRLQGALDKIPQPPADTPDAEVSLAELAAELDRRQKVDAANATARADLQRLRSAALQEKGTIERLERELGEARQRLDSISTQGRELSAKVAELADEDLEEVRQRMATAEATNHAVRAQAQRAQLEGELDAATEESERLTQYIAQIDEVKAEAARSARYPVEGLAVSDDGITLHGLPFDQASQAERLRASIAIGLALNPQLKVLLIRDGALLDEQSLRLVAQMAEEADAQVWVEVVGQRDGVTVVIEDGEVADPDDMPPMSDEEASAFAD